MGSRLIFCTSRKCDGGTEKVRYQALVVLGKGGRFGSLANPGSSKTEHRDEPYGEVTDTTLPGKAPKLQLTQTVP